MLKSLLDIWLIVKHVDSKDKWEWNPYLMRIIIVIIDMFKRMLIVDLQKHNVYID